MLTSFGSELIDVTEGADGVVAGDRPRGNSNVDRFNAIIARALDVDALDEYRAGGTVIPGKILYVPAGRYHVERQPPVEWTINLWDQRDHAAINTWRSRRNRNPFGASLRFPEELTLWMAPGAVFVPDAGCIIHIASPLVCEATRIFDLSDVEGREPDRIVVFGRRTPKVLPEWWGVEPGGDSSRAIQHAIDAAIHHRTNHWEAPAPTAPFAYSAGSVEYPPIPVELRGDYLLRHPVEVHGGSVTTPLLRIIGERGIREPVSLDVFATPHVGDRPPPTRGFEVFPDDRTLYFTSVEPLDPGPEAPTVTPVDLGGGVRSQRRLLVTIGRRLGVFRFRLNLNRGDSLVFRVVVEPFARMRREISITPATTMGGVWQGREVQGARLAAAPSFAGTALLRLTETSGFALRNLTLDVTNADGTSCLEVTPQQGMAVQDCEFRGKAVALVHLGPREVLLPTAAGEAPVAIPSNYNTDGTGLSVARCSFVVDGGGVGVALRTGNTVPCQFRECSFTGHAAAMIRAVTGTFLVDHCSFHNLGYSPPTGAVVAGFEPPDGADVYLHYQARPEVLADPEGVVRPPASSPGYAPALTMSACVSRSPRLLSAPSTRGGTLIAAAADWPSVLLNTRHLPETGTAEGFSVRWGLRGRPEASAVMLDDVRNARLGYQPPLLIVGGQYAGALRVLPFATPCAFVGPRDLGRGLMPIDIERPVGTVTGFTMVFCLRVDQVISPP